VDDFGIDVNDPFWARHQSPQEHIAHHPEVKYVLERVGDPQSSSLPAGYFDVVYSASVLEHVPAGLTAPSGSTWEPWLNPAEAAACHRCAFPSNHGMRKFFEIALFDLLNQVLPLSYRNPISFPLPGTMPACVAGARDWFLPKNEVSLLRIGHGPRIVTEPLEYGYNRIIKDHMQDSTSSGSAPCCLRFKKSI